eukprot:g59425.t1
MERALAPPGTRELWYRLYQSLPCKHHGLAGHRLHRKIHGNDDNIIYLAEQRRGVEVIFGFSLDPSLPANFSIVCADVV